METKQNAQVLMKTVEEMDIFTRKYKGKSFVEVMHKFHIRKITKIKNSLN
jgi:hypothetical protein